MSHFPRNDNLDNSDFESSRPQHHIHGDSDPIPANRDVHGDVYDVANMGRQPSSTWKNVDPNAVLGSGQHREHDITSESQGQYGSDFGYGDNASQGPAALNRTGSGAGATTFNSERPLGVQPTSAGGVAIGGQNDLPEGHATAMDKMMGKTEKVLGKAMKKPEMHERGELREAGGKAAASGQARAPHD